MTTRKKKDKSFRLEATKKKITVTQKNARSCFNKVRYTEHFQAVRSAKGLMKMAATINHIDAMTAYKCNVCGGWHISKSIPRNPNKKRLLITMEDV